MQCTPAINIEKRRAVIFLMNNMVLPELVVRVFDMEPESRHESSGPLHRMARFLLPRPFLAAAPPSQRKISSRPSSANSEPREVEPAPRPSQVLRDQ